MYCPRIIHGLSIDYLGDLNRPGPAWNDLFHFEKKEPTRGPNKAHWFEEASPNHAKVGNSKTCLLKQQRRQSACKHTTNNQKTRSAFEPRSENGKTKKNSERQPPNWTHWRKSDRSGPGCWIRLLEAEHGGEAGGHAARREGRRGGRDSPKWPLTPHQGNTITAIRRFLLQQ